MLKNRNKIFFLLLLLSISLFFAFNSYLHITDDVESNYALTAKEMVLSKDWISPQIYGRYWYDKPIFFYWQTASAFKLFGFHEFATRFWPALMGAFSIFLLLWFGQKVFPRKSMGLMGALILATSFEFWMIAKFIITDMTLFFFFNGALAFFLLAYRGDSKAKGYYYLFYLFCALATLTKGPIGFLLPGMIVLLFLCWTGNWRELRQMKITQGVILLLMVAVPWYFAMYLKHGQTFILNFFGVHNYLRATVSEHPKDNVFYYYFVILLVGFFPWIAFLPQTIKHCWPKGTGWQNVDPETKFLIIWIVVVFMFFECIATKYSTYTFAILFPLALLTAKFFVGRLELPAKGLFWSFILIFLLSILVLGVNYFAYRLVHYPLGSLLPMALVVLIGYGFCFYYIFAGTTQKVLIIFLMTLLLFNGLLIKNLWVPVSQYRSAKEIAFVLKKIYRPGDIVTSYGSYQTSAVFYSGCKIYNLSLQSSSNNSNSGKLSWASKYVMPSLRLTDIKNSQNCKRRILVILRQRDYGKFLKEYQGQWKIIQNKGSDYLLKKMD
ncbi:MAG TPA: phospholipid carrier-dependent glycosyltransferase [Firmicutes bacterium]|jgi:4-amino-4-deoxy-L-arabinose transferase-like glycosyltransferase|nr:phospholipid carrier-dependent glycosyltransferase [Bacillota bacterium]